MSVVPDTNVLVVADGGSGDDACELACLEYLEIARAKGIALDDAYEIMGEYERRIDKSGQPGAGAAFFKALASRLHDSSFVTRVEITATGDGSYAEFPDDPDLSGFDRSDHKFVAVALVAGAEEIAVATDSDWWKVREAMGRHVQLNFLCQHRFES